MKIRRNTLSTFLLLVLLALVLAACGGEAEPEAVTIEVVQNDIYYGDSADNADNPPTWTVPAGAEVTVELVNNGSLQHNWAIVEMGEEVPVPFQPEMAEGLIWYDTGLVDPASTETVTFTAPATPGEYEVICTVAGHYPAMQGRLIVTES